MNAALIAGRYILLANPPPFTSKNGISANRRVPTTSTERRLQMLRAILTVMAFALMPTLSMAEDRSPRFVLQPGTLICDTMADAIQTIEAEGALAETCGFTQKPLFVEVVREADYQAHGLNFPLVRYEFPMMKDGTVEMWQQYGFWGKPTPLVEPADFDA